MGYKLTIYFTDGTSEEIDEIFATKADALKEYRSWVDNWEEGREVLQLAGEDYIDADIDDYDIEKV